MQGLKTTRLFADKHRDSAYADLSVSRKKCEQHYLFLWVLFTLNTWEILTGGRLLTNRQRKSTFEPTYPDFPSSISTAWPSVPGAENDIKTLLPILDTNTHVGSDRLARSKLFTACWAYKRWAEVKGCGLDWGINNHDLFGYGCRRLPPWQLCSWSLPLPDHTSVTCSLLHVK